MVAAGLCLFSIMADLILISKEADENKQFLIEIAEEFLVRCKEGKIKQAAIIWEDTDSNFKTSRCAPSLMSLLGLIEWIKVRTIMTWSE